MKKHILALVTVCLMLVGCKKPDGTLSMDMTVLSEEMIYVADESVPKTADGLPGRYKLDVGRTETRTVGSGTGIFEGANETTTEVDTDVPGKDGVKGHHWLTLTRKADDHFVLTEEINQYVDTDAGELNFGFTITGDVKFVSGSWDDYKAGKPVKITYTAAGMKQQEQQLREVFTKELQSAFPASLGEVEIEMGAVQFANPVIDVTLETVAYTNTSAQSFKATVKVYRRK